MQLRGHTYGLHPTKEREVCISLNCRNAKFVVPLRHPLYKRLQTNHPPSLRLDDLKYMSSTYTYIYIYTYIHGICICTSVCVYIYMYLHTYALGAVSL